MENFTAPRGFWVEIHPTRLRTSCPSLRKRGIKSADEPAERWRSDSQLQLVLGVGFSFGLGRFLKGLIDGGDGGGAFDALAVH